MKKFQFKLQALLTVRQRAEQSALEAYGRAVLARQTAMDAVTQSEQALDKARAEAREKLRRGSTAARARQMEDFCQSLGQRLKQSESLLAQSEIELNLAFQKLIGARQEREAVETLQTHQRARHDRALDAEERKLIEDIIKRPAAPSLHWRATGSTWN